MTLVYKTQPYEYQRVILEESWEKPYWGFFMEMGTGKSKVVIDTVVNLYLAGKVDTVLYVAKKGELSNFQTYELPAHKPDDMKVMAYIYQGYVKKDHVAKIKTILSPQPQLRIFSINVEAIRAGKGFDIAMAYVRSSKKTMIIVDESTLLKDRRSSQHKALMKLKPHSRYRRIMTGTLMPHNPADIFCQSLFLDKKALGYGGVTAFRSDFVEMERMHFGGRSFNQMKGSKNLGDLKRKMRRIGTVLRKEDCLDLPDKIYRNDAVPLTERQAELYQELVDYQVANVEGDTVECVNALSVLLRLHQVVCGQLRTPDGGYALIDSNRPGRLVELIKDTNEKKVIVWCHFRAVRQNLEDVLKEHFGVVHLDAGLSVDERAARIELFKTDPHSNIFLGNPQSSGFGLTLTEASTSIYFSNSDNYEHRLQSEDRTHRIGQTRPCLYVDMRTPGTVEDAILNRTTMKAMQRNQVMQTDDFLKMIMLKERALVQ